MSERLAQIVGDSRKVILLLADEKNADGSALLVARLLFESNRERLDDLQQQFISDPAVTKEFLDFLENDSDLHDVDKLFFRDLLLGLPASPRVEEDRRVLESIQARYDDEMRKVFGKIGMRGMIEKRERWEEYLSFLRRRYQLETIIEEHRGELQAVATGTRGRELPWRDTDRELVGLKFPEKTLVLTFDDGPHCRFTDAILDILDRYHVKAVFFEVGRNIEKLPGESKKVAAAGHTVANHTFTHAFLPKLKSAEIDDQILKTNQELTNLSVAEPVLFRSPYGARNEGVLESVQSHKMRNVMWNVDSLDWADPVPLSVVDRVLRQVAKEKRGILLFHDIHQSTVEALPMVLEALQRDGYTFLTFNGAEFAAEGRGVQTPTVKLEPPPELYRQSWAAVIGINKYQHWPQLSYAVNDANAVRDLLVQRYGFVSDHVLMLLDEQATREAILSLLGDKLADAARVQREDRVFVFFAGHGLTRQLPNGRSLGYIVPVDADQKNYQSQAISMTNFQDISEAIPAKHLFFVMDACYSGLALTRGSGVAAPDRRSFLKEITRRSARQVLTAGGADEQVADNGPGGHSVFTWTLIQGLEGRADLDGDGIITAPELAAFVGPGVSALSHQTPAFGNLAGSEGGEFVFEVGHEREFLGEESKQLDDQGIKMNGELERVRKQLAEEKARNEKLQQELAAARDELPAGQAPATPGDQARAEVDRGMLLFRERRYPEAAEAFSRAVELNPQNARAVNNLGFVYFKMGKLDEAVAWFRKTIAVDPGRAIAYANLGDACVKLHRLEEARAAYRKYLELEPSTPMAALIRHRLETLP